MSTAMVSSTFCELGYRSSVNYRPVQPTASSSAKTLFQGQVLPVDRKNAFPVTGVPAPPHVNGTSVAAGDHRIRSASGALHHHPAPLLSHVPHNHQQQHHHQHQQQHQALLSHASDHSKPSVAVVANGVSNSLRSHTTTHSLHQAISLNNNILLNSVGIKSDHKKLDRSISEPVDKNQQQQQQQQSSRSSQANSSRYKTELCRPFEESGTCKYGDKCQFAHGIHELRNLTRHPKYKTELCRTFHTTGFCPYGPRCHFIHNSEETKKTVFTSLQAGFPAPASGSSSLTTVRGHRIVNRSLTADPQIMSLSNSNHCNSSSSSSNNSNSSNISCSSSNSSSNSSIIGNNHHHPSHEPQAKSVVATGTPIRNKAMSVGSFSIGSSGDLTPPSSPSGSPTSMGSFFADSCCGSPMDNSPNRSGGPRLPTFARFANNNSYRDESFTSILSPSLDI